MLCPPAMLRALVARRELSAFLTASLLHYVESRAISVHGLNERFRPAGLGDLLAPGSPFGREELQVLFQGQAVEAARAL
eukprot:15456989-Alexandrium_andersonii.AAC.1